MGYFDAAIAKQNEELAHHGIIGQKWGVRRFQNYDGTRIGAGSGKKKTKKPKHDFQDHSESKSRRGETYGMLGLSALGLAAMTALNAVSLSSGFIYGQGILGEIMAAVGTVTYASLAVKGEVDNAVANSKEKKFAKERAQNPVDKSTGFHKKTTDMTPKEDMERVNPAYKNWDENTKNNCVLCTMSYELRRRGYDVQARKATEGYDENLTKDWFTGAKIKQSNGGMSDTEIISNYNYGIPPFIDKEKQSTMISNTIKEIKSQKDGARGQMCVTWDGTVSAHSVAYANEGGEPVIYDTQANKMYKGEKAVTNYLKKTSQNSVTRLDNCKINKKYIKEVAE